MFTDAQIELVKRHQPALTGDRTWLALACDGPSHGNYISFATAVIEGYRPAEWPTGEFVWQHESGVERPLTAGAAQADLEAVGL